MCLGDSAFGGDAAAAARETPGFSLAAQGSEVGRRCFPKRLSEKNNCLIYRLAEVDGADIAVHF